MYNLHLSPEQIEIRDTVRDFVAHEVKPPALDARRLDACDRTLLTGVLEKASGLGLRTLALPEDLGGAGADSLTCCIVGEELATGDADIAAALAETSRLARLLFDRLMTPEQRERLLPPFLTDDRYHLAFVGDEPALGINYHRPESDDADAATVTARRSGREWIVQGADPCVANAAIAKLFAVKVDDGTGAHLLLMPRETPGLCVQALDDRERWYHGPCAAVTFTDCRVPAHDAVDLGAHAAMPQEACPLHLSPQYPAIALGIGRAAYEAALAYAQLRVQGGRRIVEHQAIGTKLADIAIRLEVARTAVRQAAWATDHLDAFADRSLPDLPLAAIARVFALEAVYQATKDAAECFGAMGVMRDMPLQKYVHDALICLHSGHGTRDARLRIAEALVSFRRLPRVTVRAAE